MPLQTEHRFLLDLASWTPPAAESPWPTARPGTGGGRVLHAHRHLPGLHPPRPHPSPADLPTHDAQPVVVVPGPPTTAARVRRILGDRVTVTPSASAQAHLAAGLHRTLLLRQSGIMLVDSAGVVRYRLATALPAASTAQRCRPRPTGCNAPTILPQRAAKG